MKGDKRGISSKAPDQKLLFLLKIKTNKTQAAQIKNIMQSSSTFIRISGPIPEIKKSASTNDCENITYWKESEQSEVLANKFGLSQIQFGDLRGIATPEKFSNFSNLLNLETVYPVLKLTKNCYLNMNISLF